MRYVSTRDLHTYYSLSEALHLGLAPDGGLFVPEHVPTANLASFSPELSYPDFCAQVLAPFFEGDALADRLPQFCEQAFNFKVPLKKLDNNTSILELFHGPTLSFKDFGARFLGQCLGGLATQKKITVMVATSGDTGSAVAAALHQQPGLDVIVLFPEGQVSARQQHQITCWGDNVKAYAVQGTFDDCQRMVKSAFEDVALKDRLNLCTANSINVGRLLPQMCYYAFTSVRFYQAHQEKPNFMIPSGNLGNSSAAYWAKMMGFPMGDIVLAHNANRAMVDYLQTGIYEARSSIPTLANAMDVGDPSNVERLQYLFNTFDHFSQHVSAHSVSDDEIEQSIKDVYAKHGYTVCPHTATGYHARAKCNDAPWIVVGTADPCKFETIIEPLIGRTVPVSPALTTLLDRSSQFETVVADLSFLEVS
jgi:threonine synthase